jgi:hypothetical protein
MGREKRRRMATLLSTRRLHEPGSARSHPTRVAGSSTASRKVLAARTAAERRLLELVLRFDLPLKMAPDPGDRNV